MWNDVDKFWRTTTELAWESFKKGSLPIAAIIVDTNGQVVSEGRNKILEKHNINRKMLHAEMNALMDLDYDAHPEIRKYTMYTTLEPCPMCMGSIVMSDIRKLRIAAKDPWAGAVEICKLPYIADKNMDISFEIGPMSNILTVIYLYRLWEGYGTNAKNFLKSKSDYFPNETVLAQELLSQNILRKFAEEDANIDEIYNHIERKLKS